MTNFDGEAIVLADGVVYPCHAKLRRWAPKELTQSFGGKGPAEGKPDWDGVLDVGSEDAAFAIRDADDTCLRIDDREGRFYVSDGDLQAGELEILGNDGAPFG